jgi:hypothetical protein
VRLKFRLPLFAKLAVFEAGEPDPIAAKRAPDLSGASFVFVLAREHKRDWLVLPNARRPAIHLIEFQREMLNHESVASIEAIAKAVQAMQEAPAVEVRKAA